jgi:hypothetical protein
MNIHIGGSETDTAPKLIPERYICNLIIDRMIQVYGRQLGTVTKSNTKDHHIKITIDAKNMELCRLSRYCTHTGQEMTE